jgi:hypothetical protein
MTESWKYGNYIYLIQEDKTVADMQEMPLPNS